MIVKNSMSYNLLVFINIFLIFTLPSLILTFYNISRSICISIICFFLIISSFWDFKKILFNKEHLIFSATVLIFLLINSIVPIYNGYYKPVLSVILLFFIIFSSYCFAFFLRRLRLEDLKKQLGILFFLLLAFGWVYIFFDPYLPKFGYEKYVFPFTEHSHYALCVGFLGIIFAYNLSTRIKVFVVINLFLQGILFPNFSLLLFSILGFFILFLQSRIFFILGFIFLLFISISFSSLFLKEDQINYFTERLVFEKDTYNLTTLVYLQGLDDALRAIKSTYGLGLGFQMAGTNEIGIYGESIRQLRGHDVNREDAGFLAAKLVAELGILGFFICIIILYNLIKFLYKKNKGDQNFISLIVCCLIIEVFFRGYGYFSSQILFLLIAFFYYRYSQKNI